MSNTPIWNLALDLGFVSGTQNVSDEPLFLPSQDRYQQADDRFPTTTDVVVVGGGLVGLSTAVELASRGRQVSVICQSLRENQTNTGLGVLLSYLPTTASELEQAHGSDSASAVQSSVDAYQWTLEKLATIDRRFPCRIAGHLVCGHHSDSSHDMKRLVEFESQRHGRAEFLAQQQVSQEIGSNRFSGALSFTDAAVVDPGQIHLGYHHVARMLEIPIFDQTRVLRISKLTNGGFELRTSHGRVRARDVVVCTGHQVAKLLPRLRSKVGVRHTITVATPPLELDVQQRLAPTNRVMSTNTPQRKFWYLDPSRGRLLFSMPAESHDLDVERQRAVDALGVIYPELTELSVDRAWFAAAPTSSDRVPRVGKSNGVGFVVKGDAHQLSYSVWLGHQASELIMGSPAHRGSTLDWSKTTLPGGQSSSGPLNNLLDRASAMLAGSDDT